MAKKLLQSVIASLRSGRTRRRGDEPASPSFRYEPDADGDADPGEIVWTWVAYEDDPSQGKDRPVAVLGRRGTGVVGVALTTKYKDRPDYLELGSGPWDPEHRPSWVKLDRLIDIDPRRIRREGCALTEDRYDSVLEAVARFHGWQPDG